MDLGSLLALGLRDSPLRALGLCRLLRLVLVSRQEMGSGMGAVVCVASPCRLGAAELLQPACREHQRLRKRLWWHSCRWPLPNRWCRRSTAGNRASGLGLGYRQGRERPRLYGGQGARMDVRRSGAARGQRCGQGSPRSNGGGGRREVARWLAGADRRPAASSHPQQCGSRLS